MKKTLATVGIVLLTSSALSQCGCGAATVPFQPMLNMGTWWVGGTILDAGTAPGRCRVQPACPNAPLPCIHNLLFDIYVAFPANTNPAPTLTVHLAQGANRAQAQIPPSSALVLPGGQQHQFNYQYPLQASLECGENGSITLVWSVPGGGPGNSSGGAALACGNC
jgi:hypothetical protein